MYNLFVGRAERFNLPNKAETACAFASRKAMYSKPRSQNHRAQRLTSDPGERPLTNSADHFQELERGIGLSFGSPTRPSFRRMRTILAQDPRSFICESHYS